MIWAVGQPKSGVCVLNGNKQANKWTKMWQWKNDAASVTVAIGVGVGVCIGVGVPATKIFAQSSNARIWMFLTMAKCMQR